MGIFFCAAGTWKPDAICTSLKCEMAFPIRTCVICEEEFELRPGKPGFANRCPKCSIVEDEEDTAVGTMQPGDRRSQAEANEARRKAIRDLLYRKDS